MNIEHLKPILERVEGRVPHLYLDTKGFVTTGVGHLVPSLNHALTLSLAPKEKIESDWSSVKKMPPGLVASKYAACTVCRMSNHDIDTLFTSDIQRFVDGIAKTIPKYGTWPELVQTAVFDMSFNLGMAGFAKYHHLLASLNAGDWKSCAAQCHRNGISETRNQQTAQMFLDADNNKG